MEETQKKVRQTTQTPKNQGIIINKVNYSYLITKSKNKENSLLIQLYEPNQKSNIYFTYEAPMQQIINEVKFLSLYESLDEIIDCLNDIFCQGNALVEEKNGVYVMELYVIGIKKKYTIKLNKHEIKQPKEQKSGLESKFKTIETYLNDLYNKYEELKVIRKKEIKDIVKEVIFDDDIAIKLFEKMKQISLISSSKNNSVINNKSINNNIDNNIINKVKVAVNHKENKMNNQINIIQHQLKDNINYVNKIKSNNNNNNNNYIIFQVKIDEKDLNKDIALFNQVNIKIKDHFYYVFNTDNFDTIIDGKMVNIMYDHFKYYWNFTTAGIHTIKIIFKKKLIQCKELFSNCKNLYKVDISNFDCSEITDCSWMFNWCSSLEEINLGKIDFALSNDFSLMFNGCKNIKKLDVSNFITKNSKSFAKMFYDCSKLKEINLSKFNSTNCKRINGMFCGCSSLKSIDISNWDLQNIENSDILFSGCSQLKRIKMNFNSKIINYKSYNVFKGLPDGGSFIFNKDINCSYFLRNLPDSWFKVIE